MANEETFRRQCEFVARIPTTDASSILLFLLGVSHAKTSIDVQTLYPFLHDSEASFNQRLIAAESKVKVDFQVYQGFIGKARELLTEFKASLASSVPNSTSALPSVCASCDQAILPSLSFTPSEHCGHQFHSKCAQAAIRSVMMQGGLPSLLCPASHCAATLSEADLTQLFSPEDYQILVQFWARPVADCTFVAVICPNFTCKASTMWRKNQFFECGQCKNKYCLLCLGTMKREQIGHQCGETGDEQVSVGEAFAKGNRFKVCVKCGYWCDLTGAKTVTCRCSRDICTKCVLYSDQCECNATFVDKLMNLPDKIFKNL